VGLIIIVLAVAAILIFAIIWTSRKRPSVFPSPEVPRPSPAPPSVPLKQVKTRLSAAEMLSRVQALLAKDNQWDVILPDLNPTDDPEVQRLLISIRGPHMFAPHVGLNVIEEGCKRALSLSPNADALQALYEAIRSQETITGRN
jgi:hypothetical protein